MRLSHECYECVAFMAWPDGADEVSEVVFPMEPMKRLKYYLVYYLPMILPNYKKSIVNLMSSLSQAYGVKHPYKPLTFLPVDKLKKAQNIILLVIDGLGTEFLKKNASKNSIFTKNRIGNMTSVCLSTTTAAVTTFLTGEAPQQHGLISWFINIKELGEIVIILASETREGRKIKINFNKLFKRKMFFEKTKVKNYWIIPRELIHASYNHFVSKKAKLMGFNGLNGLFYQLNRIVKKKSKKKTYTFAYWPHIDLFCHHVGTKNKRTKKHFKDIESELEKFVQKIKGTNTILLITADHGLINSKGISLNKHKKFIDLLSMPVSGDSRMVFCYIKKGKKKEFESYVKKKLSKYCKIIKSKELLSKHYFGLGKPNPKLIDRIGDYTLICKKNYAFKQFLKGDKKRFFKASHSGFSKEEMIVPLIMVKND